MNEDAGFGEELEVERMDRLEAVQSFAFSARRTGLGLSSDLEGAGDVEGENAEDLPGRISGLFEAGNTIEGEAVPKFGMDLFMTTSPVEEVPEVEAVKRLVGGDCRVLVVAVVGVEQVQLEVLARLVRLL